ncbi:MAG: Fic family protein [Chloroflexi bacterium]|nr:MAG: Fic family protein [Chloroflexota bacterium]
MPEQRSTASGRYIMQPSGYRAFIPERLPPTEPIVFDSDLLQLLSDADRALGRLDGVATVLPNPDLFVAMYVRHEAVLSSQIEGTQSTLEEVLQYEAHPRSRRGPKDVEEVVNYVRAMNHGLRRLDTLPLSLRLLREVHQELLQGVRGEHRSPGEFRSTQNWIGPQGCSLGEAEFVPPPPDEMSRALGNLEDFLHSRGALPALAHCAYAHAQFETIHPFLDGNGRVGRLLVTLLLCERNILQRPLLYLSVYLKAHRAQYYDRLQAIRHDGDWEGWLRFFLSGVAEVSRSAAETARAILRLREDHRSAVSSQATATKLLDLLFDRPIISVRLAEAALGCSYTTAANAISRLQDKGFLEETTGQRRNRLFRYGPYLDLFHQQILPIGGESAQTTDSSLED